MRQFVKCDYCDSPIYFGQDAYQLDGCSGCYCSPECYANDHAKIVTMDEDEADNCFKEVYTDESSTDTSTAEVPVQQEEPKVVNENIYTFKNFSIRRPVFITSKMPDEEYFKYNFDIHCEKDGCGFSIGHLTYDPKEGYFDFRSVGTRYLQYRDDGLEEWILAWCKLKTIEIESEDDE